MRHGIVLFTSDRGITPADLGRPAHYGLVGMRERMQAIGGTLRIERGAGGGTVVAAQVPIEDRGSRVEDRR